MRVLWDLKKWQQKSRSSRLQMFFKVVVRKNFTKFTGKHLFQALFFNKVAGLRPATLLKLRLWRWCFPVNFVKFWWIHVCIGHFWWLLLKFMILIKFILVLPVTSEQIFSVLKRLKIEFCSTISDGIAYWLVSEQCSHFIPPGNTREKLSLSIFLYR